MDKEIFDSTNDDLEELIDEDDDEYEDDEELEEEDEEVHIYDYFGYPYAMETVNGYIVSLLPDLQTEIRHKFLKKINLTEAELAKELGKCLDENEQCLDYDSEFLTDLLGFDSHTNTFHSSGLDYGDSRYGYEANSLLEDLGYRLSENIQYGAHGHDTFGVYFIE